MKFSCLGYADERLWDAMSESEREAIIEECFAYEDTLRRGDLAGQWISATATDQSGLS